MASMEECRGTARVLAEQLAKLLEALGCSETVIEPSGNVEDGFSVEARLPVTWAQVEYVNLEVSCGPVDENGD